MEQWKWLADIGEWTAYGLYEGQSLPYPGAYGRAYRRTYENLPVNIHPQRLLHPYEPFYRDTDLNEHVHFPIVNSILNYVHSVGLWLWEEVKDYKKAAYPAYAAQIDALWDDLLQKICFASAGGVYMHNSPDLETVLTKGFDCIKAELQQEITRARREKDEAGLSLLLALEDYTIGIDAYFERVKQALTDAAEQATGPRREELLLIRDEFARCFYQPADSFVSGVLAANFLWMLDGCDGMGRFDYLLGDLFDRDIQSGRLELSFARRLLDDLWQNYNRLNGWNFQIGGRRPDGTDGCNALTRECLLACRRNRTNKPNLSFRINPDTPPELLALAYEILGEGNAHPALYNDDAYIRLLMDKIPHLPYEDAAMLNFGGCTETMLAGMSSIECVTGYVNYAKAVSYAMMDGYDVVQQKQVGPHTGRFADFADFPAFLEAVRRQTRFVADEHILPIIEGIRHRAENGDPQLCRTLFTRDCVRRHRSFYAGGARYNFGIIGSSGTTVMIDSLAAVKYCVFDRPLIDKQVLVDALVADFEGYEDVRDQLLAAPKFGNDQEDYEVFGREILEETWNYLCTLPYPKSPDGFWVPCIIHVGAFDWEGKAVGATPDGRRFQEVLNDSAGPFAGRDKKGPTAVIRSVTRLPLATALGTPVLNLRFHPAIMKTPESREKVAMLIQSYFDLGGLQVQITVVSSEELRKAQQTPEKYAGLLVRVGGYCDYFVRLTRRLQDTIIARAENNLS